MATFPTPGSRYTPPLDAPGILLAEELSEIAERAQAFTSATGVVIALRRCNELVVRTSNGIAPEVGACIPLPSGVTGLCVTTKKPQTCVSADAEAQLEAVFRAVSVRSVLSVPVQWDGEVRGVLAVLAQIPEAFSRTHVAILMTLRDVIANKLSQCELPPDSPRQAPIAPVELDVDSLLNAPAPPPTVVAPRPAAPEAVKPTPVQAAAPVPRVAQIPATPAASAGQKLPAPTFRPQAAAPVTVPRMEPAAAPLPAPAPAKPLAELIKEPAEAPVKMSPDVLCAGEDPGKYGSLIRPQPMAMPEVRNTAAALASSPIFAVYRAPAKSNRKNVLTIAGAAAAVVVLGLVIALYPGHKPPAAPATAGVATQEAPVAAPAPALIAVPLPKSAGEHPPAAAPSKPAATAASAAKVPEAKGAAEEPKQVVEVTLRKSTPILHLPSAKPVAKSEEPVEPPSLGLMANSGKALPELATMPLATPSLAARKSALVPATLVQGRSPRFPESARRQGLSGIVKLQLSISAEGKVTDVRALSGDPLLRQASILAVRDWVYRPAYLDGTPVESVAEVSLRFNPTR